MPDILVVGAGVIGSSVAFHLAERGDCSVAVVDAHAAGQGMSSRSSALVRMHYTFEPEVRMAVDSLGYFTAWPERVGRPAFYRQCGFVRIVAPGEAERLRANVAMQRASGADVHLVGAAELREIEPGWSIGDVSLAAYEPGSGYGDGALVAGDFMSRAREMGAGYRPGARVQRLLVAGDRVTGAATKDGDIHAGLVILATGVWTPRLLAPAGIDLPIVTEYHEVAMLSEGQPRTIVRTACIDSGTRTYFRPEGTDKILIGDFVGAQRGDDPDHFPQVPGADSVTELISRAIRRVPAMAQAGVTRGVTGLYDMTPDARPLLGAVSGVDGLIVAAGFSGMGFKISPAVGRSLAELALDGTSKIDLRPFRPGRFAEGEPISPVHAYADD